MVIAPGAVYTMASESPGLGLAKLAGQAIGRAYTSVNDGL